LNQGVVYFDNLDREQKTLLFTALHTIFVCEACVSYYFLICYQGRIEVARKHATFIDGKMLSVTKINIEFKFYWYKHMNHR